MNNKLFSLNNLFCLVIFSMPLYMLRINIFGLPSNLFEIVTVLAIIFFAFAKVWVLKNITFEKLPRFFLIAVLLILFGVLLSIFFNGNQLSAFSILKSWFLLPIMFSSALFLLLNTKTDIEKIFLSIYFSSAFIGFIGIIYKLSGLVTYDNRLEAFYLSPNYLAMYLSSGLFFGLYFLTKSFRKNPLSYVFFMHAILMLFIFVSLYYTYSYGAWFSVFLSLLIMIIFFSNKKRTLLIGIFGIFAVGIFIFQINTPKFTALFSERSSFASRNVIWNVSALMIKQNPFFGIGPGNFQEKYLSLQKYFPPYLEWAVPEPHSVFLAFWLQTGIIGLVGFLLLLGTSFRALWKLLKNKKGASLAAPLLGFFIYTSLHGLLDTVYWKNDLSFLFWVCIFIVLAISVKPIEPFATN